MDIDNFQKELLSDKRYQNMSMDERLLAHCCYLLISNKIFSLNELDGMRPNLIISHTLSLIDYEQNKELAWEKAKIDERKKFRGSRE